MASVRALRKASAYVVWGASVLLALGLAGAALLVALKADPSHAVWGPWIKGTEALTPGWFARPDGAALAGGSERDLVMRWGAAAVSVLASGALVQWIVRPRPERPV